MRNTFVHNLVPHYFKRKVKLVCFAFFLTLFSGTSLVYSQTASKLVSGEENSQGAQISLNLQDVDIRVLINTVAEVTGKNFIVDPRVKGKVSVISGSKVTPDQLYDIFLAILEVNNIATVDSDAITKVLPSNVIKQQPTRTLFSPSNDDNDEQITQIIQLQHAPVQDLVAIVRPLIPPTSHFAPHIPSNSVILTDTAANIQRVLRIIKRIDVPDKRSSTHVVYLHKAKASDLANALTQLVATTVDPKQAATTAKVSIQPIDAINALVISATDEEFLRIKALIEELDVERELQGDVNVIALKYAKAEDLVDILNDLTQTNGEQGVISEFTVQADEASNSLIVKASSSQLKTVQSVIDKLDKRRAQVFVETIIAEVSLNQQANLGITWGAGVSPAANSPRATTDGILIPPTARDIKVGNRPGTGSARQNFALNDIGWNYSLLDFGRYQLDVIINALRSDSNSNVLSTPTILTLDNEEAEIVVGQEVPFVTGRYNNGLGVSNPQPPQDGGGEGGNNNNNRGGTISNTFQTIERKDVGIKLKIKPQINEGDTIQLEVMQETSSVSPESVQGQADLITNRRSIEATVQVDDGQIVVLGGLITDDLVDTVEWVPFLGKIPIIGALFRNKSKKNVKRNLMVFLKPRIIRTPEDLANYSKVRYDDVRRDSMISRNQTDDFLIKDAEPPVLLDYTNSVDEGLISTESRQIERDKGDPKRATRSRIKDIIFGRRPLDQRKKKEVDEDSTEDLLQQEAESDITPVKADEKLNDEAKVPSDDKSDEPPLNQPFTLTPESPQASQHRDDE